MSRGWIGATGAPGEVVTAVVSNPLENPRATGKVRPAILIRREGSRWAIAGLTTRSRFRSGVERPAVPDWAEIGLRGPGFFWARKLTQIGVMDVRDHLGWVSASVASALFEHVELTANDVVALSRCAESRRAA
jgi:hypothetical protein